MDHDRGELSRDLGVRLPASARIVGVRRTRGIDDAIFVKLELPKDGWQELLAASPIKDSDLIAESRGYLEPNDGWWDPASQPSLRAAQVNLPGGRTLNLGADTNRSGAVVVYLMNHGK